MKHIGTALLISSLLLTACGSREENDGNSTGVIFGPNGEVISGNAVGQNVGLNVRAISNANAIETGSTDSATITALITDQFNLAVADQEVRFIASGGVLQNVTTMTNEDGEATAELKLKQSYEKRTITVTVVSGTTTDDVNIEAVGTDIEIVGPTAVVLGNPADLTMTLVDGTGQPIANEAITVSSEGGNTLAAESLVTDSQGRISVTVASTQGDDTITATALGATVMKTHEIKVAKDILTFISPAENAEFAVGTTNAVEVEWQSENVAVAGQQLRFSITAGQIISNNVVTTDSAGRATIQISSTSAGPATLTVAPVSTGEPNVPRVVEFVATTPSSVTLTSSSSRVPATDESTITALVTDISGNPVKNTEVVFSSADLKGGQLTPAGATTNSEGMASITFKAGNLPTEVDEIELVAEIDGNITGTHRLTVVEKVLNITLGTSGLLDIIANEAQYGLPFAVQVADGGGQPLEGATVELSITPTRYFKGQYQIGTDTISNQSQWVRVTTAICESEDLNGNRRLDPGEDVNNNGILDPQDPAVIAAHASAEPTVMGGSIQTDTNGSGYFNLLYPASSSRWSTVDITARARALGVEAEETFHAVLMVSADRLTDLTAVPPNVNSPYGVSSTCTDEL